MESLYDYLRVLREKNRYSQADIAQKLGITQASYRQLELGNTKLTVERLFEIARIFKVKPETILYCGNLPTSDDGKDLSQLAFANVLNDAIADLKLWRTMIRESSLSEEERQRLFVLALDLQHTIEQRPDITQALKRENEWKYSKTWVDYLNKRIEFFDQIVRDIFKKALGYQSDSK